MKTPLEFAVSQLGITEVRGNKGIPFERYSLSGEEPLPWCARFIRWCYLCSGRPLPGQKYLLGAVTEMQAALKAHGGILTEGQNPRPGDLIFLKNRGQSDKGPGHHVGIVEQYGDRSVVSIDGNWGDRVTRVTRDRANPAIWCFGRWPIDPVA